MKVGLHAIIEKIHEDAARDSEARFAQIAGDVDCEIGEEQTRYCEETDKQHEILQKRNAHEYAYRIENQRARLNRQLMAYQRKLTEDIFAQAAAKLQHVSDEVFHRVFCLAAKGLSGSYVLTLGELSAGKISGEVIAQAMKENQNLHISLAAETIERKSGFTLSDDRVEYNCLFEDLAEDLKNERMAAIIQEVFGDSADWTIQKT